MVTVAVFVVPNAPVIGSLSYRVTRPVVIVWQYWCMHAYAYSSRSFEGKQQLKKVNYYSGKNEIIFSEQMYILIYMEFKSRLK